MLPNLIDLILISRCQRDLAEIESGDSLSVQFRHRGMRPARGTPPEELVGEGPARSRVDRTRQAADGAAAGRGEDIGYHE